MNDSTKFMVGAVGLGVLAYVIYRGAGKVGEVAGQAASAVGSAVGTVAHAVNPVNNDNVFATGVNNVGAAVSGNSDWSLGTWLFDVFNPDAPAAENGPMPRGTASGAKYTAPPATTNGVPSDYWDAPTLSGWGGASFKDLSDPYDINGFRNLMPVQLGTVY